MVARYKKRSTVSASVDTGVTQLYVDQALATKSDVSHGHTKASIGLDQVDNTADINKPVSNNTQAVLTALGTRIDTIVASGGNAVTSVAGRNGAIILNKNDVGLDRVDNTSDVDKPVSAATQAAINTAVSSANGVNSAVQSALDAKANSIDITNVRTDIVNLTDTVNTKAAKSDVTAQNGTIALLQEQMAAKADVSAIAAGLATKADSFHDHRKNVVFEICKYIDFHEENSSIDFDVRLESAGNEIVGGGYLAIHAANGMACTGDVWAFSDERLKKDWEDLPEDFLEKLAEAKHGLYTKIATGNREVGVSAQSIQKVLNQFVSESLSAEKYLSVVYGNAALVSSIQLAKRLIKSEKEIQDLKARLETMESIISSLKDN